GGKWNLLPDGALPAGTRSRDEAHEWHKRIEQLRRIRSLPEEWDGEGCHAPDSAMVDAAVALVDDLVTSGCLPADRVLLGVRGPIVLEWHSRDRYVEIEVTSPRTAEHLVVDRAGRRKSFAFERAES